MRVLIVGCGYVGLALGVELVRQGHQVFGLRRSVGAKAQLLAAGITPVVADIARPIEAPTATYDWVVNCASSSRGGVEDYRSVYLKGIRNVLNWVSAKPPAKFVYTSSTSVYGQMEGETVSEESETIPASETARVLVETEKALVERAQEFGIPAVILRVAGIYGPERGYWLKQFLKGEARIEGDGQRVLNMVHRDDVAGAIVAALQRGRAGEIYNAVDDEPVMQLDFFQWLAETLGKPLPPFAPEGAERKRAVTNKRVSNRKLKEELGYKFRFPTFREGCMEEIKGLGAG